MSKIWRMGWLVNSRQKAYRKYLESDHWAALRSTALERDHHACTACGSIEWLQVHHMTYRSRFEDSLLADLETLCRPCHRKQHGFSPSWFARKAEELERSFMHQKRPPPEDFRELKSLIQDGDDLWDFGEFMFNYVFHMVAHEQHSHLEAWWMDKALRDRWFNRARNVRNSIQSRPAAWSKYPTPP